MNDTNEKPSRLARRLWQKSVARTRKKAHRAALHGLPRLAAPPSLLQSLRMAHEIESKKAEVDRLLAAAAKPD